MIVMVAPVRSDVTRRAPVYAIAACGAQHWIAVAGKPARTNDRQQGPVRLRPTSGNSHLFNQSSSGMLARPSRWMNHPEVWGQSIQKYDQGQIWRMHSRGVSAATAGMIII
jgi:hypothetical protein